MGLMVIATPPTRFRPPPDPPPYESSLFEDLSPIAPPEPPDPPDAVYLLAPLQIPKSSANLSLQEFIQTFVLMLACPTMVTKPNRGGAHLVSVGDTPFAYGRLFPVVYRSYFRGADWSSLRSYLDLPLQSPHTALQVHLCLLLSADVYSVEWVGIQVVWKTLDMWSLVLFSASSCSTALMLILSLGFSAPLPVPASPCCCYDSTRVRVNDILFALVQSSTAVCSPLHVFTPNYDRIRWLFLPLWQCEELVFDIFTQLLNIGIFSTFSFMEFVFFPHSPLVFSGCVAGSIVSKLTDTLLSDFRKGLAKWSLVTYALSAEFMIVYSTLGVVSILGFRAVYMLSKSLCSISSFCIIGIEDRGLLHVFTCLAMMFALILYVFVLRFVIAVCLAGLAVLLSTLNNCSMDGV